MSRWKHCCIVLLFVLGVFGPPLFADINQSVLILLTKLSRDYVQYREEVFFKIPLAVVPFVNSSPLAKQHEIGAVVDELIRSEISNSTYFILTERENLEEIRGRIDFQGGAAQERPVHVGVGAYQAGHHYLPAGVDHLLGPALVLGLPDGLDAPVLDGHGSPLEDAAILVHGDDETIFYQQVDQCFASFLQQSTQETFKLSRPSEAM